MYRMRPPKILRLRAMRRHPFRVDTAAPGDAKAVVVTGQTRTLGCRVRGHILRRRRGTLGVRPRLPGPANRATPDACDATVRRPAPVVQGSDPVSQAVLIAFRSGCDLMLGWL
jgi:hypothetical protein